MRTLLSILIVCTVVGLAYWAYQENIKTQNALTQTEELQRDIGAARARLSVLRAEWAYLNRPDRLTDLVNLNYNRLHLTPLQAVFMVEHLHPRRLLEWQFSIHYLWDCSSTKNSL